MPRNNPFMVFRCNHGTAQNGRESRSYVLGVLNTPSRVPTRHTKAFFARLRGCPKAWLVAFKFGRFSGSFESDHIFRQKLIGRSFTTYNVLRVLCTIWISPECHQMTHLWFFEHPMAYRRHPKAWSIAFNFGCFWLLWSRSYFLPKTL